MTVSDVPNQYAVPEVENLLEEAIEILAEARPLPMSTTVKVNRDELLLLLEQAQDTLPEELRAARWLLKEREDFINAARQEHKDLIEQGRAQVSRMVERQEVVKAAEARARQIVADARHDANMLQRQTEEYCDKKLAGFEMVLERTSATVQKGRQRLMSSANSHSRNISDDSTEIDLDNGSFSDGGGRRRSNGFGGNRDHGDSFKAEYSDDDYEDDEFEDDDYVDDEFEDDDDVEAEYRR